MRVFAHFWLIEIDEAVSFTSSGVADQLNSVGTSGWIKTCSPVMPACGQMPETADTNLAQLKIGRKKHNKIAATQSTWR